MPVDPEHWLYRFTPREWLRASMAELTQAKAAYARKNGRAGLAGCRRAAGVAINALLASEEEIDARYGRTYMDHLTALRTETRAVEEVHEAASLLLETPLPGGEIVALRTTRGEARMLAAAETVMAWCYGEVVKREPRQ